MKDQTDKEPSDRVEREQCVPASVPGDASSRHDGKHGMVQCNAAIEQVLSAANLQRAWKRVKANRGAPGIDAMSIDDFPAFKRQHWERIDSDLRKGTYRPAPVRRVFIDKPDGTQRPLGIPTVLDRVIQQAIAQVLTPLYDGGFSDHSYGFREGRSAHQAVRTLEAAWKQNRRYAVDCDLKSFFDTVNHERLLARLQPKIGGGVLLRLIGRYLRAGVVLPDGIREATPCGVPQGGPLSPLLANIVLDPLDKTLVTRGHTFARYANDFIVMVRSAKAAQRVMKSLTGYVEGSLKLVVNQAKSRTAPLRQCTFLGFQLGRNGKVVWSDKAKERFKLRIRLITSRNRGCHVRSVIDELRRYVTGWINYFGISHSYKVVLELDKWLRRRVRLYYWKQWKQPRTRRRHLIALGISPEEVKLASRSRKGYWRMSSNALVQRALSKQWLLLQGVPELRPRWVAIHYGSDHRSSPVV
jgi:RNA-directed DNA polymerase